jgi:hypothetical protein
MEKHSDNQTKLGTYGQAGLDIGNMTDEKNAAYGDSVARSQEILRILYPNGVKTEQYRDMQLVTRIIDKLFRIATDKPAFGESPFKDIAGYAVLGYVQDKETPIGQKVQEVTKAYFASPPPDRLEGISGGVYYYLMNGDTIGEGTEYSDGLGLGAWHRIHNKDCSIGQIYDNTVHMRMRIKK